MSLETLSSAHSGPAKASPFELTNRRKFLFYLAMLPLARIAAKAQDSTSAATLHVKVKLVNVYAIVRNKSGAIIQNLNKDDFAIAEDNRPQKISFFSHENNLPLTLGLLVDTSPSEYQMISQETEASRTFLDTVVDPKKDKAFLIHFDHKVELLQDVTSSLVKLENALATLQDSGDEPTLGRRAENIRQDEGQSQSSGGRDSEDGGPSSQSGGGSTTHLFDAVYLASNNVLKQQTGRKALVIVGDGDDMGSMISKERAIRAAQQADALIYCIRIVDKNFGKQEGHKRHFGMPSVGMPGIGVPGLGGPGIGGQGPGGSPGDGGPGMGGGGGAPVDRSEGKKNLEALAVQTGGALFEVSKKEPLEDIFTQIQQELRSQYSMGYTPNANAAAGYRHIQVTVKPKGLKVQAREGYYPDRD
jgi:VWFA-related protein